MLTIKEAASECLAHKRIAVTELEALPADDEE